MKINKIYTIFLGIMLFLGLCFLSSCNNNKEPEGNSELFISYYDDGVMIQRKKYTKDNFSLLVLDEKEGYDFIGWFLDENLVTKFDESKLDEYFKNEKMSLYSCWELTKNNFVIEMKGLIGDKSVINPAFTWDNTYNDNAFVISVMKGEEEVVNKEVKDSYYICEALEYNTSYKFTIKGKDSNNSKEVSFTTVEDNNYNTNTAIVLNDPFMNNMVIQREEIINLSGVGPENMLIAVKFGEKMYFGISDVDGKFDVEIEPQTASFDPIEIEVGVGLENNTAISNVLIGDVFFFSGQSNMQWPTNSSDFNINDIQKAKDNNVRYFVQNVVTSSDPVEHTTNGRWFSISGTNYSQYSAICTMGGAFLSEYLKDQNVPVGILSAYQGNTNIANWMSKEYYTGSTSTKHLHYNAMVHPLRHAKVKAVVWYQGCNNSAAGGDYKDLLLNYFANYRDLFNDENLPFYVIGLACYDGDSGNNYDFSYVRESQAMACDLDDNAYYISTCDDGDPTFIHPTAKRYIAQRVAKSIMSSLYGYSYLAEGPSYKSHTVDGNKVTITFNNANGLRNDGEIKNLYLAGEDGKYYEATAKIVGETVVASCDKVSKPVYIKYGFGKSPFVNIFNKDGYSMVPFRTDKYNLNIDLLDYNDINNYGFHLDGSKMDISYVENGLKIVKANDGMNFGSIRLDKWGMIGYQAAGFRLVVTGTNSGAKITFRAVEGPSYETWGYTIVDNFEGNKVFEVPVSEFKATLNKSDNIFNTQCISYIEIVVEKAGSCELTINEARFVEVERSKPTEFTIDNISFDGNKATVTLNKSLFVNEYTILVSRSSSDYSNPVFTETKDSTTFSFDVSTYEKGVPYYVRAIAKNELGETVCSNDSFLFYVQSDDSLIISNFDYETQAELDSYISSNMKVHEGLNCVLQDHSLKIESTGAGWQNFIFVIETGANAGMNKLVFDADFTNYKGTVVLELVTAEWQIYSYTLDLNTQKDGTFTINLSDYYNKTSSKNFNNEKLMWISFNFSDNQGNGYILFDDCKLTK